MLQFLLGLSALALIVFHFITVPSFFKGDSGPLKKFKEQFISFLVVAIIIVVGFAAAGIRDWNKDLIIVFLMVFSAFAVLGIYGFSKLRVDYHKYYSEEVFLKKYARQEENMRILANRAKELDERSQMIDAKSKEFESLKSFLESQKEKLKFKESELSDREGQVKKYQYDLEAEYRKKEAEYQEKVDALNDKEDQFEHLLNEKLIGKEEEINVRYKNAYEEKMNAFMDSVSDKFEKRINSEKQNLVEEVFSFESKFTDDIFELKRTKESIEKEKAELDKNKFLLEVDERVSKAREHVLDAKHSALEVKSENIDLRSEMKLMAGDFKMGLLQEKGQREKSMDSVLHNLELEEERRKSDMRDVSNKISLLGEQTKGQIIELASIVSNNLKDLEMRTMTSFREVRENLSDMKLQFGQEILRLDGQQGQILNELEKYYIKNQEFVNKCQSLAFEARKQNIEGHNLLNQVNHMYSQHKLEAREMENQLQNSLEQVSVKEGHLANSIGESMLKLKGMSDEQYIALKDLALEKKDINLLWREKNQEHEMNLQEVRHQKQDLDRTKQFFDQEKSHFSDRKSEVMENARLTHQLYMNEQRYTEAIKKVQSSQGFLTRIAKAAEYAMAKK